MISRSIYSFNSLHRGTGHMPVHFSIRFHNLCDREMNIKFLIAPRLLHDMINTKLEEKRAVWVAFYFVVVILFSVYIFFPYFFCVHIVHTVNRPNYVSFGYGVHFHMLRCWALVFVPSHKIRLFAHCCWCLLLLFCMIHSC